MLLLAVTALCSLVQFPFSVPNYFCYVAPLVALTALALYSYLLWSARIVPGLLIVFLVVAGSLWIMSNLNDNMMPGAELMNLHMQH